MWAFGCVLFELLAGKRAFEGEDVSDTLAAVLRGEPDWTALPPDIPPHVRTILKQCLDRDRKTRIPEIAVVRFLMTSAAAALAIAPIDDSIAASRSPVAWKAATALFVIATIAVGVVAYVNRPTAPRVTRFFVAPPDKGSFIIGGVPGASASISPDGTKLAFTARDAAGKVQLWVRPVDALTAQPLAGTDDAGFPFWSPDSRYLAFFAQGKLQKIAAGGGPPQALCSAAGRGGVWTRDGVIVFNGGPGPLLRVSSAGGEPVPITKENATFPAFLPDGRHVLFWTNDAVYVITIDGGEPRRLLGADSGAVFAPPGYLLFVRAGTLLAQSFDAKTLELTGDPFPIAERVEFTARPGLISFSVSDTGILAYGTGAGTSATLQLVWLDRQGKTVETVGPPANYRGVDLAPDGTRIAAHRHDGTGGDVWITEFSRGATSRFTFDASQENASPIWSPDGRDIAYGSRRVGKYGLYRRPSNGAGNEEVLLEPSSLMPLMPMSWSADGKSIVYGTLGTKTRRDMWLLPLNGNRKPVALLDSPFDEARSSLSPDGKWLAYDSNESGRQEIYVRPFPSGAGKWQVSTSGGASPRWRRDGRELFFSGTTVGAAGRLFAADVKAEGPTFVPGAPRELFRVDMLQPPHEPYHAYAVSADGQRFLFALPVSSLSEPAVPSPIAVVLNWVQGLRK